MWMTRASSPSSRSERKTRKLWCPSLIAAWGCPHSRRSRSSMPSLLPSPTGPAWDFASAAPSSNRMVAACGLPTTHRAAQAFLSPYPPKPGHIHDTWVAGAAEGRNVKVSVADIRVEHEVRLGDFTKWVERKGGSPRDVIQRQKIREILGMGEGR